MCERVDQALAWARAALARACDSEPSDAHILLVHVLGVDHTALIAHPERPLSPAQVNAYRDLVTRRVEGVPVAYLTGLRAFYDREFWVTPDVLIPRPETEHLIEAALDWARGRRDLRVADVGTGSGAIAVTLAAHLLGARVWALDVSADALAVARRNVARYSLSDRVTLVQGNLLEPLLEQGETADLIAANLPYIPTDEVTALPVARREPVLALDGGPDGLDLIRRLLDQAVGVLAPGGLIALEIGAGQGARVCQLAGAIFPGARVRVLADYAGYDRVVCIETVERNG
ncbi:MAG: peptide chain release factor N(5)-glutamine methyltransferase [Anaerolineae bacterium]|nr:peptide chain release factor N(5)-glutamine methyltransferase [Anaerolineae bacterium]